MAIKGTIQGKDVIFFIKKDGVYVPFVCAKEVGVEVNAEKIPTKTVGDGQWKKYAYQSLSYSVNLTSVLKFDDNNFTGWDFLDNMLQFVTVEFKMLLTDVISGKSRRILGELLIEKSTFTASPTDLVMNDLSLPGTGPLLVQNPANDCFATIVSGHFYQTGTTGRYQVTNHTGGALSRVDYQVDGGGYLTVYPTTFIFDLPLSGLTAGDHNIEIIPYCINGFAGLTFNATFNALAVYTVVGRVEIDPTTICGGSTVPLYRNGSGLDPVLYTDAALTTPITGYNIFISDNNILHLNSATGVIGSFITTCPNTIRSTWVRLNNNSATICSVPYTQVYTTGMGGTGTTYYTDAAMTVPVTGFTFVDKNTGIFDIDPVTGLVGGFVGDCPGEPTINDYVLGNIPSICDSPDTTYYMSAPFAIGVTLWVNSSLTTQLSNKDKFALTSNGHIYDVNPGTGVVLSDSGATCTVGIPVNIILGNASGTVCGEPGVVRYVTTVFGTGETLYTDATLSTPVTGFDFVVRDNGDVYNLDSATGVIGAATGVVCGASPVFYDLMFEHEHGGEWATIYVTNQTTSVTTSYTFFANGSQPGILEGGTLYTIEVDIISGDLSIPITITGGDGNTTSTSGDASLTATNVKSETVGIQVHIGS